MEEFYLKKIVVAIEVNDKLIITTEEIEKNKIIRLNNGNCQNIINSLNQAIDKS